MWALLVALLLAFTAACGSTEVTAPTTARTGDAGAALAPGLAPRADQGHLGPGAIRCSRCHTPEERDHTKWRETAMRLGHDVQSRLAERTTCQCCHLGEVKSFGQSIERVCAECHDDVRVTITGMGSIHCLSCHDLTGSGGTLILKSAWECTKCHAQDQGDKPAIHVHSTQACSNCHHPHEEPWTVPRKCTECHEGHETFHGADVRDADGGASHPVAPHAAGSFSGEPMACATCHAPHEVGGAASGRCYQCHAEKEPATFTAATTFAGGHERCTTCHVPHGEANAGPVPCRSCHAGVVTLGGRASEAHGKCVNCHQPHDVLGSPAGACVGCHSAVHVEHPDPEGKGCVGCHNPHPGPAALAGAASPTLAESAFPKASSQVKCSGCHTEAKTDLGFHDGTTPCKGCHVPHAFTRASAPACSTCHAPETAAAVAAGGHGHGECKGCHQTHEPKAAPPACGSCHEQEAKTALAGHTECRACHEAHPASRAPEKACATCHARQKNSGPHAAVACSTCHRPHGPDAPAGPAGPASKPECSSCHAAATLGGMHVVQGHSTCTSCHGAHKAPSSTRETCLACHADRKDHEPTAAVCSGCHGFRK
jgi:Doubled CXXCH motif (Paired_CXXCH_1)